jgi:hypothetical protein
MGKFIANLNSAVLGALATGSAVYLWQHNFDDAAGTAAAFFILAALRLVIYVECYE